MAKNQRKAQTTKRASPSNEEIGNRQVLALRRMDMLENLGRIFLICATIIAVAYVGVYLPIKASAGQTTTITYVLELLTKTKASVLVSWIATACTTLWGWLERRKRIREREEKDKRLLKLEKIVDPNRSSSNLSPTGEQRNIKGQPKCTTQ